jgi:trinucleotide repeat-containing gene 6 protein
LQQIKTLQQLQQQHSMAQSQKPMGGNSSSLLAVSVNITKTKQNIQNLQNQISAQQAAYLKSQQMPPAQPQPPIGGASSFEPGMPDIFGNYGGQPGGGHVESHIPANKSRLNLWKLPEDGSFSKAPGASSAGPGKSGNPSGLPFDDNPWASSGSGSGWPETSKSSSSGLTNSDSISNGLDSFGIPEFEPGKPWKGPGMKNPDEDPNLTPGSMAPTPIDINALSKATNQVNLQASASSENSLGLAGSTWSFGGSTTDLKPSASKAADGWNAGSSGASNLTPMGQDLWGKSGTGRTPPGLGGNENSGGWPSSNGWNGSNAQNGDAMMNGGNGHCWILLKNLTQQIDALTLKTLCMQHGPLKQFQLWLNHNIALVMYGSGREAQKAQKALHNCVLGNTTIHATITSEGEATAILGQLGSSSAGGGPQLAVTSTPTRGNTPNSANLTSKAGSGGADMWGGLGVSVTSGPSLFSSGTGVWSAPGSDLIDTQQRNTPQLQQFLPGDLLGENM